MPTNGKTQSGRTGEAVQCHTALVTRIALFLRLLSKENFQRLIRETNGRLLASEGDLLKLMISKGYIQQKDVPGLKKTCLSFARAQTDTRFGSLCIEFGFLTQSNLNLALEEQKGLSDGGRTVFLGDLLVEAGMLSEQQQKLILQKQKMDHTFQENSPTSTTREIREKEVIFYIPEDGLRVHGVKTDQFDSYLTVTALKDLLEKNGVIYGVTDDRALESFLTDDRYKTTRFELAKGLDPVSGTDAQIFYLFEQNYLSAGQLSADGSIDYKTRGRIPFVCAEDVLAEKIPAKSGRDGVNVFGDVVEAVPPLDMDILCDKGVALSEDGLKAVALTDGYPKVSLDGVLSVNDAHVIRGDVDYTTGHVKFSKNVFITGTVKAGFKVEAKDVVAREVDGGIIVAQGDVSIANGITNARISANGAVSAAYIHRSTIGCLGDMEIGKEVVESNISLEGTFDMSRGKMLASTVSARGGAKIYHIGSIKSVPSNIEVGTSPYLRREVRRLNQHIEKNQNLFDNKTREYEGIKSRIAAIDREIKQLNQAARSKPAGFTLSPEEMNQKIQHLRSERLALEKKTSQAEKELNKLTTTIKEWVGEKFNLQHHTNTTPPKPILDVRGRIISGTIVRGQHSSTVMSKDLARVRIMEMSCASESGNRRRVWEMVTSRL